MVTIIIPRCSQAGKQLRYVLQSLFYNTSARPPRCRPLVDPVGAVYSVRRVGMRRSAEGRMTGHYRRRRSGALPSSQRVWPCAGRGGRSRGALDIVLFCIVFYIRVRSRRRFFTYPHTHARARRKAFIQISFARPVAPSVVPCTRLGVYYSIQPIAGTTDAADRRHNKTLYSRTSDGHVKSVCLRLSEFRCVEVRQSRSTYIRTVRAVDYERKTNGQRRRKTGARASKPGKTKDRFLIVITIIIFVITVVIIALIDLREQSLFSPTLQNIIMYLYVFTSSRAFHLEFGIRLVRLGKAICREVSLQNRQRLYLFYYLSQENYYFLFSTGYFVSCL